VIRSVGVVHSLQTLSNMGKDKQVMESIDV
jgi:hypothetical protein